MTPGTATISDYRLVFRDLWLFMERHIGVNSPKDCAAIADDLAKFETEFGGAMAAVITNELGRLYKLRLERSATND